MKTQSKSKISRNELKGKNCQQQFTYSSLDNSFWKSIGAIRADETKNTKSSFDPNGEKRQQLGKLDRANNSRHTESLSADIGVDTCWLIADDGVQYELTLVCSMTPDTVESCRADTCI